MAGNTTELRGTVHGKTIELDEDTGLPDGQQVHVTVKPVPANRDDLQGHGRAASQGERLGQGVSISIPEFHVHGPRHKREIRSRLANHQPIDIARIVPGAADKISQL